MAGNPDLLFIDEPTVGMDVKSRKQFWNKIHELAARGKTILFSTHYLQEVDDIASRIILFNKGKIVVDGTPENIKNKLTKQSGSFTTDSNFPAKSLLNEPFMTDYFVEGNRSYIMTNNTAEVLKWIHRMEREIRDIHIENARLEEAFEELINNKREGA